MDDVVKFSKMGYVLWMNVGGVGVFIRVYVVIVDVERMIEGIWKYNGCIKFF